MKIKGLVFYMMCKDVWSKIILSNEWEYLQLTLLLFVVTMVTGVTPEVMCATSFSLSPTARKL